MEALHNRGAEETGKHESGPTAEPCCKRPDRGDEEKLGSQQENRKDTRKTGRINSAFDKNEDEHGDRPDCIDDEIILLSVSHTILFSLPA